MPKAEQAGVGGTERSETVREAEFARWIARYQEQPLLRVLTCGSVDDGKSTLIGRLLHDAAAVLDDQLATLAKDSARFGTTGEDVDYALLLDGLQAEREQGITIDVAYRYFSTPRRKFIVADTPGHEQYTRNMATGASTADLAILLVDARKGVLPQTRRHAALCSLLGIRHVVVAVNKMDLVGYAQATFEAIRADCNDHFARLSFGEVQVIPLCARRGENVVQRAASMPWYQGAPLLEHLETVHVAGDRNLIDLRLPVQYVLRPSPDFRGFAGTLASGILRVGDEVVALPSGKKSRVKTLASAGRPRTEVCAPMAVTVTLEDEIDLARGDVLARPNNAPPLDDEVEAMLVWMAEDALEPGRAVLLKHGTTTTPARVADLRYRLDVITLRSEPAAKLALNEIGRVRVECARRLAADAYATNRRTGAFILIDRLTNATLAAGMVLERTSAERALSPARRAGDAAANLRASGAALGPAGRARRAAQEPFALWLTGLPRAGKSSIAWALHEEFAARGLPAIVLDGENLRRGISSDLGFSESDRGEHVRRAAELARMLQEQGWIVLCALVSPSRAERARAKDIAGAARFLEVHCDAPLSVCEARDTDGLYERARAGELVRVSGVDQPYEAPETPDLRLDTATKAVAENARRVLAELEQRGWLARPKPA